MGPDRVASLPMYDFPELRGAHAAFWTALSARLEAAGVSNVPPALTGNLPHGDVWRHPSLLFAQGCEYPLASVFRGIACGWSQRRCIRRRVARGAVMPVRLWCVAQVRGGAVAFGAAVERGAGVGGGLEASGTLADFRGRRCAINEPGSNSGMNLLRAAVAPLATGGRFFGVRRARYGSASSVVVEMIASGEQRRITLQLLISVSSAHFSTSLSGGGWSVADSWLDPFGSSSLPFLSLSVQQVMRLFRRFAVRSLMCLMTRDWQPCAGKLLLSGVHWRADRKGLMTCCSADASPGVPAVAVEEGYPVMVA